MSVEAQGQELLGRCEDLVRRALARGADQAEAYADVGASMDVDIEADRIAGSGTGRSQGFGLRVVVAGRLGFAYATDETAMGPAIDAALAQARIGPGDRYSLPSGGRVDPLPGRWDDALAALDVDLAVDLARDLLAAGRDACPDGSVSGGGVGIGWGIAAVASSEGVASWDRSTQLSAGASMVLEEGSSAINAWDSVTTETGTVDATALGSALGATMMSLRGPKDPAGGVHDVVLLPDAGAELVTGFLSGAIDGDDALRGRSVWSDRLDQPVAHPGLQATDDPRHAGGLGTTAMDGEGLATLRTPILEDGVLRARIFDSWYGHVHGRPSTHHAQRSGFKSLPGTGVHHWLLEHTTTRTLDALIADVEHGYLVESVLGAHTANATTGDFSVTAPNVWRIQDGALAGACKDIAMGGNLPELLARLDGVSDAPKRMDGAIVPALRFRDVQVSV